MLTIYVAFLAVAVLSFMVGISIGSSRGWNAAQERIVQHQRNAEAVRQQEHLEELKKAWKKLYKNRRKNHDKKGS